jgi:serine/threonine protein kinase
VAALAACVTEGGGAEHLPDASAVTISAHELGRGSGAVVRRGEWRGVPIAAKLWSSDKFSDGDARSEWVMGRLTGGCAELVRTLAAWEAPSLGMAVELLDGASAVGGPPSMSSVTRDAFDEGKHAKLSARQAVEVARTVARAAAWMHARGLMHGDLYLHNTLRAPRDEGEADIVRLSDLGAACAYDRHAHAGLERLEVRSYGWLVEDLLSWRKPTTDADADLDAALRRVAAMCLADAHADRPSFDEVARLLDASR